MESIRSGSSGREQREEKQHPLLKIGHYVLGDTLGVGTFGKVKGNPTNIRLNFYSDLALG